MSRNTGGSQTERPLVQTDPLSAQTGLAGRPALCVRSPKRLIAGSQGNLMHIAIANVLSAEETKTVRAALERAHFIEGGTTAGFAARTVKDNRQAAGADRSLEIVRKLVAERILGNELFC